jgi:hypothetical protein
LIVGRVHHADDAPALEDVEIPLICGPMRGHEWPPEDMAEMEAGWWAYRDQIMEEHNRPDWRPWGWWEFEAKEPRPDYGQEAARLAELLGGH